MRILVSTGALIGRPNGRDYRLLSDFRTKLYCDGFEFMMYSDWYDSISDIIQMVRSEGISIPTYHCQKSIGEAISKGGSENLKDAFDRFGQNAEMAAKMGASKLIMHLWDGFTSDSNFESNLRAYKTLAHIASECGVDLLVENVVCNVKDPMTHLSELRDTYPDIHFVFDTKMAAFHGQLELLYEEEYAWLFGEGHIRHLHVNDYGGGYMDWQNLKTLPVGQGKIDFDSFFAYVKKVGYDDTVTLESTAFNSEGIVDFAMLNAEIAAVKKYLQ